MEMVAFLTFQGGYGDLKDFTETYELKKGTSWEGIMSYSASQPEGKPSGTKFVEISEYPAKLEGLLPTSWPARYADLRRTDTESLILGLSSATSTV